jgi:pyruvate dehydrogenase E1 component alpha subunit
VLRYYGHFEGDATTYRPPGEVAAYKAAKDPLMQFRNRVVESSVLRPDDLDAIDAEVKSLIAQATVRAKAAPMPTEADLMTDVYNRY